MTTSNTELAAQARKSAEWLDSLDLRAPDKIMNAVSAATALRQLADAVESKAEPVAWMSPGKERLEFSRPDTVYGSHTIPLYTAPVQPETTKSRKKGPL